VAGLSTGIARRVCGNPALLFYHALRPALTITCLHSLCKSLHMLAKEHTILLLQRLSCKAKIPAPSFVEAPNVVQHALTHSPCCMALTIFCIPVYDSWAG
jgi:hypothetical protein